MWLFTGGCHVDRRCGKYSDECIECPMAGRYAHSGFIRKKKWIQKSNMRIVGPSNWIVEEAKKSDILRGKDIRVMYNVYNEGIFNPILSNNDRDKLKCELGLDVAKKIILFGAADDGTQNKNKGFEYLLEALKLIDTSDIQLCVIGHAQDATKTLLKGYDVVYKGFIADEYTLADIYRAADSFVNPSLQESFGYTVCESMACGTPAVAFAVGGMLDQIEHKQNGYLSDFCSSDSIAEGIKYVLNNREEMGAKAAASARRYSYGECSMQL